MIPDIDSQTKPRHFWKDLKDLRSLCAIAVMLIGTTIVYLPRPSNPGDNTLLSMDYLQLHERRIQFARQALFEQRRSLPAWYPRELFGTPFWSNLQNFPFIPSRLALLAFDPLDAMTAGVLLAGGLSALFTYLFARRLKLGQVAAAAAGWTFAASGFFAARVMAGHLPLLEAYPALPLLLWLVEIHHQAAPADRRRGMSLAAIGLAAAAVSLAGHPQLPAYALSTAALYALFRGGRPRGASVRAAAAVALGFGCAAFALWPMWRLIQRSTRLLPLDPPNNDVAFPYARLAAFFFPWKDGWPATVARPFHRPFTGFPNEAYFWDTVCYVGWLPWIALVALLIHAVHRRKRPGAPWMLVIGMGTLGMLLSLPVARALTGAIPGTIFRSPARLMYLPTFALALTLGAAIDVVRRMSGRSPLQRNLTAAAVALALSGHALDLGAHDRSFISMTTVETAADPELMAQLRGMVGDGHVAIDYALATRFNRQFDDVGFFDSIMLAKSYAALMDVAGEPPGHNEQAFNATDLPLEALQWAGVKLVVTPRPRADLKPLGGGSGVLIYAVPDPSPRVKFVPLETATFLPRDEIHTRLRRRPLRLQGLMFSSDAPAAGDISARATTQESSNGVETRLQRDSTDQMSIAVQTDRPGFVRILESWDVGWHAMVDGVETPILAADDAFLAVPLKTGTHNVQLKFATPGAAVGLGITVASLALLTILSLWEHYTDPN